MIMVKRKVGIMGKWLERIRVIRFKMKGVE